MKTLCDYPTRPMNQEEMKFFMDVTMSKPITDVNLREEILKIPICKIMDLRFPDGFQIELKLLLFVADLTEGNPAKAVMWAYTLYKNNIKTFDEWVHAFPMGFPTDEAYNQFWDSQKVRDDYEGSDNLLDRRETWE